MSFHVGKNYDNSYDKEKSGKRSGGPIDISGVDHFKKPSILHFLSPRQVICQAALFVP